MCQKKLYNLHTQPKTSRVSYLEGIRISSKMEIACPKVSTASLNNKGLVHMKVGELGQALHCFRQALWITFAYCDNLQMAKTNDAPPPDLVASTSPTVAQQVTPLSVSNSRSDFFRAIGIYLVPSSSYCYDSDEFKNSLISSAIVMYNLALLFHLGSLAGGKVSDEHLSKAVLLYQQSKAVLEIMGIQPRRAVLVHSEQRHAILDVIGMATLNNLGHCLFLQEDYIESQQCLNQLEQWVLCLDKQPCSIVHDLNSLKILAWHRCNCLLSVITLKLPKFAAAA